MPDVPRKRVLIITRNLPPLVGGMERLNWHMAEGLSSRMDVRVIGPKGAAALAPTGVVVEEVSLYPLPRFLLESAMRALQLARRWRPDFVLAGSGLTAPLAWLAASGWKTARSRSR
jgi:phosphatidylinositol alpha-1,6-mannosyltransferase